MLGTRILWDLSIVFLCDPDMFKAFDISTFILLLLLDTKEFTHFLPFFIDEPFLCTLSNDNDAVTAFLSSFDDPFIDSLFTVELEIHLRNETYIDIATGKSCVARNVAAISTHESNDSNTELSTLSLNHG